MTPNIPPGVNAKTLERALKELRAWSKHAIRMYAASDNDPYRVRTRILVEDLERAVYALERLLHPASGQEDEQ